MPELALLHKRHIDSMRFRDLYEARKAFYLHAAVIDPKKRRTLKLKNFRVLKPETRQSPQAILAQMRLIASNKQA